MLDMLKKIPSAKRNHTFFLAYFTPGIPMGSYEKLGPAGWAAIAYIYTEIYKYIYERRALLI